MKWLACILPLVICTCGLPRDADPEPASVPADDLAGISHSRGLQHRGPEATRGYVLFSPNLSDTTYLVDLDGRVVHTWKSEFSAAGGIYPLPNGNLLRSSRQPDNPRFGAGGQSGRLQEITWDGQLAWDYTLANEELLLHHDVAVLPSGNILSIAYEYTSPDLARSLGARPENIPPEGFWTCTILELQPQPPSGAEIVWQWRMRDHLIQHLEPSGNNYGGLSENPGRLDINAFGPPPVRTRSEVDSMIRANNAPVNATPGNEGSDVMHTNAIDYHPQRDHIVISSPHYDEIYIIDHGLSTAEAATVAGDILWRWGNPQRYGAGDAADQILRGQHDVRWIEPGMPGAGNMLVFNNQNTSAAGPYSAVLELEIPYSEAKGYGKPEVAWSYIAADTTSFYAPFISGAHRMANGHTFITSGPQGRFFEVTAKGEIVWDYWTPYSGSVRIGAGLFPQPMGPFIYGVFRATHIPTDHPLVAPLYATTE